MQFTKMRSNLRIVFFIPLLSLVTCYTFPKNDYEFSMRRDALKEAERVFEMRNRTFTKDEEIVDHYMQHLKWEEFVNTKDRGFPPSRPIEEMQDQIKQSKLFRALKSFPKGGNMHTHEDHQVSRWMLADILFDSGVFENLYILPENHTRPWVLDLFMNPPTDEPWEKVQENPKYTRELIAEKTSLLGIMDDKAKRYPTDSGERWKQMNPIWGRFAGNVINHVEIKKKYLTALFQTGLEEGVQYVETRKSMKQSAMFVLDPSGESEATFGKKYIQDVDGDLEVNITLEVIQNFTRDNPSFIGMKRIIYGTRRQDMQTVLEQMDSTINLVKRFPKHLLGFDLVGEEDAGNSHLFYLDAFLSLFDNKTGQSRLQLWQHTAETNWPDELITANNQQDPVATAQNAYEAILLGSRRVGHGLAYVQHPYLMQILKERGVAIEICPISNQILGYVPDLRDHPAVSFMRNGIPVVLGSDDAGSFGVDDFNLDWYTAFLAWGLNLGDLKQLAVNSLKYSGMTEEEKADAIDNKWASKWQEYIADMKNTACDTDFSSYSQSFNFILPKDGALEGSTKVHIFGRNFEKGICNEVMCKFGDTLSPPAVYVSNHHLICESPDITPVDPYDLDIGRIPSYIIQHKQQDSLTVPILISLNGGTEFIETGQNFTYKYSPDDIAEGPKQTEDSNGSSSILYSNVQLLAFISISFNLFFNHA